MVFRRAGGAAERSGTPAQWLVVGLGNPGTEYEGTRHNVGADAVSAVAASLGSKLKAGKERALACEVRVDAQLVALAVPQTFMNLSGESVRLLVKRHGVVDPTRLVVIHDELDLACGDVRIKAGGGLAGHNGLKSIANHLGSQDFVRVRIGIGRPPGTQQVADFVLRRPGKAERTALDSAIADAVDAVDRIVRTGVDAAMNVVNAKS